MDEETKETLVEEAKRALGIDYEFSDGQRSLLIETHQRYLDWDDALINSFSEATVKKAEKATEKYKTALRDCGVMGDMLTVRLESVFKTIRYFSKIVEDEKEYCQSKGIKSIYDKKRGSPGNPKLRCYISQMAAWYKEYVGDKPAYAGERSKFPKLIKACLAVIELDAVEPSSDIMKNVLKKLPTGPTAACD
jgi:hypothetical protein